MLNQFPDKQSHCPSTIFIYLEQQKYVLKNAAKNQEASEVPCIYKPISDAIEETYHFH